jgi:hypothetical protein
MIPRALTDTCRRCSLFSVGRALAKTWMSAARSTETSDQGLRPRRMLGHLMDRYREPRGGRSLPFAVSNELTGSWAPFVLRHIEGKTAGHGATAATAADTKCQTRASPTPLTEQAIAAPADSLCEVILSLAVFLPSVFTPVLRV